MSRAKENRTVPYAYDADKLLSFIWLMQLGQLRRTYGAIDNDLSNSKILRLFLLKKIDNLIKTPLPLHVYQSNNGLKLTIAARITSSRSMFALHSQTQISTGKERHTQETRVA